jgi:hypothetical protein
MPAGEEMFKYHGYSGPCPKPPEPKLGPDTSATDRIIAEAMRTSRDNALDAAIELCEEFAAAGHNAACCVRALKDLKAMMPAPPSAQN